MGTRYGVRDSPDMHSLVGCARRVAEAVSVSGVTDEDLLQRLHDVLYVEKDAWGIAVDGLITRSEAARLVLANLESWLIERSGRAWPSQSEWDLEFLVLDVENALFGAQGHS